MDDALTRRELVGAGAAGAALLALRPPRPRRRAPAHATRRRLRRRRRALRARRRPRPRRRRPHGRRARGARPRRRAHAERLARRRAHHRARRRVRRPDQDRILALAAAVGVKTFRDLQRRGPTCSSRAACARCTPPCPGCPTTPTCSRRSWPPPSSTRRPSRSASAPRGTRPRPREWDRMTLDEWMRSEVPSDKGRAIFISACQSIWGADPKELSLLYVAAVHAPRPATPPTRDRSCASSRPAAAPRRAASWAARRSSARRSPIGSASASS